MVFATNGLNYKYEQNTTPTTGLPISESARPSEYRRFLFRSYLVIYHNRAPRVDQDGDIKFLNNSGSQELVALAKTEDRLSQLQSDIRISSIEPHRVLCGFCQQWIKLRDDAAYIVYNWNKHIGSCERKHRYGFRVPPLTENSFLSPRTVELCQWTRGQARSRKSPWSRLLHQVQKGLLIRGARPI